MITIAVVIIVSSIVPSSAQPSPDCITAYNATFNSAGTASCAEAYFASVVGNATSQQKMMVCDASEQCSDMIENVINICGNEVSC